MLVNASAEIRKVAVAPLAASLGHIHRRIRRTTAWDSAHTCRRRSSLHCGLGPPTFPGYPVRKLFSESNLANHSKLAAEANRAEQALSAWEWDWIDLGGEG
jgi:hypothetical protein